MKNILRRTLRKAQKMVSWSIGGFLPAPLAGRSTLLTAAFSTFVLTAFSDHLAGLIVGYVLGAAVVFSQLVLTIYSSPRAHAQRSTISLSYFLLLAIGVSAVYSSREDQLVWLEWASLLIMSVAAWLINALPIFLQTKPLVAANFVHNPSVGRLPRVRTRILLSLAWASLTIVAMVALTGTPLAPVVTAIIAVITFAVALWKVVGAWKYADQVRWRTLRELQRMAPKIVIPYGGTAGFHPNMWYPHIDELDEPYYLVPLTEAAMEKLKRNTNRPMVVPDAQSEMAVRQVIPDSVRIAYYPHNSSKNSLFRADHRYKHVFVHHGDGDKAASFSPSSAKYDYLFVAGQGAVDRYANNGIVIPPEKFVVIGRPQTMDIEVAHSKISDIKRPTVLYAPTWYGRNDDENYCSLPIGPQIVIELIKRDVNVIFRPHPASKSKRAYRDWIKEIQEILKRDLENSDRQHLWDEAAEKPTVSQVTNSSDAMVADVSGIVTDYLQSGKPYAMATVRFSAEEFERDFPTSRSAYVITGADESLTSALDDLLGDDPLAAERWKTRDYFLGGFEGRGAVEQFIIESKKIIEA